MNLRKVIITNKCTSIDESKCILSYANQVVPTLTLCRNGEIKEQLVQRMKEHSTVRILERALYSCWPYPYFVSEIDAVLIQDKIPRPDSDPDGEKHDYVHLGGDGKNECNISQCAKKGTAQTLILTCGSIMIYHYTGLQSIGILGGSVRPDRMAGEDVNLESKGVDNQGNTFVVRDVNPAEFSLVCRPL